MKKFFLFVALFAAVSINAKEVVVDLNTGEEAKENGSVTWNFSSGELKVDWSVTVGYGVAGVEFPVDALSNVSNLNFDYKGDGSENGIIHYLRDSEGNRWWDSSKWLDLEPTDWTSVSTAPSAALWDGQAYAFATHPITSVGFIANPDKPATGTFTLRNVKLIVRDEETAVENTAVEAKTVKVIRNGQMVIIRDGKTFNALGAEIQ